MDKQVKKKRSAKPKQKTKAPDDQIKVNISDDDKRKNDNLRHLALIVKEIFEVSPDTSQIISSKKKELRPHIAYCNTYINSLTTANCKVSIHHVLYYNLFQTYRTQFLHLEDNLSWMNNEKQSINIQLGKGTKFEKQNITLKLSMACNIAIKMKKVIDDKDYDNINDQEEARSGFRYQFLDIFYYRLIIVIIDSLPKTEKSDMRLLIDIADKFRANTHLKSDESDTSSDEETGANALGQTINNMTGGSIGGKELTNALKSITSNPKITTRLAGIFSTLEQKTKEGEGTDSKDIISSMVSDIAPVLGETFDALGDLGLGKKKTNDDSDSISASQDDSSKSDTS